MNYKIAFTGPESTGKTTLSKLVSETYNGIYIQEFAREYLEKTKGLYQEEDLVHIAEGQFNSISQSKNNTNQLIVSDNHRDDKAFYHEWDAVCKRNYP